MPTYIYRLDWLTYCWDGFKKWEWETDVRHFQTLAEAIEYLFYQRIAYNYIVFRIRAVEVQK